MSDALLRGLGLPHRILEIEARLGQIEVNVPELIADSNFYFTQSTAVNPWTIDHNLGKRPSVSVIDGEGREVQADVEYPSLNRVVVRFSGAMAGTATLN